MFRYPMYLPAVHKVHMNQGYRTVVREITNYSRRGSRPIPESSAKGAMRSFNFFEMAFDH